MKYKLTVERTYRIGIEFEADSEEYAEYKAAELAFGIGDKIFDGDCENDYALYDEEGRTIVDWS